MPHNPEQWAWFAFYTGGALLAWLWFIVVAIEVGVNIYLQRRSEKGLRK